MMKKDIGPQANYPNPPGLAVDASVVDVRFALERNPDMADRSAPSVQSKRHRIAMVTDFGPNAAKDIACILNALLADAFALFLKTKNFHWHVRGPHFRDYHLLFDEQATEILAMTDEIAERVRKLGEGTLRSIGDIARHQTLEDNDASHVHPLDMLVELRKDNQLFTASLRRAHHACSEHNDVASTSLIETYIDHAEKRAWFLYEASWIGERPA
jgi:starvation-inducible DNA-binding protein